MRRATSSCNHGDIVGKREFQRAAAVEAMVGGRSGRMGERMRRCARNEVEGVASEYIDLVFRQLLQGISRRLPSQCAVCHAWPAQPMCEACVAAFAQPAHRCRTCALIVPDGVGQCGACITQPPPLDACLAAVSYAYPWSTLIADFKFHQQPEWAASFVRVLRATPWVEPALERADLVIPMPLSRQRLQERGYNQALLLARALEPAKLVSGLLLRVQDTPPQRTLPRSERLRNVRNAYALEPERAQQIRDRAVLLVDDVMTSGASLHAAALVLRRAGAAHISALVLARTE